MNLRKALVKMIIYQSECMECGQPCLFEGCSHYSVPHIYCDECGCEEECYDYVDEHLCKDCLLSKFNKVTPS